MPIAPCPATSRGIIIHTRTTVRLSTEGGAGRSEERQYEGWQLDANDHTR